jgi:CBS domain containing-hemolysin-like protein
MKKKEIISIIGATLISLIIGLMLGGWSFVPNRVVRALCLATSFLLALCLCEYIYNKISRK